MNDTSYMCWEDIAQASQDWQIAGGAIGSPFDKWRGKYLPLPTWYDETLDPEGAAYLAQQDRIWREMVGEQGDYQPSQHEITQDSHVDPIVKPGFYSTTPVAAGDHLVALGHILRHSGLRSGARVLEYGAGFGQIALTFARMGCEVHTVDIDPTFCDGVSRQAAFFGVDLTAHRQEFGFNPGGQFDLIVFYECFHHAREWIGLIPKLRAMLSANGKVLMAGEPVWPEGLGQSPWCPYPWGIRLDAEVAAITRFRKWYELGFRQDFLHQEFEKEGFSYTFRPGHISSYADIHEFALLTSQDKSNSSPDEDMAGQNQAVAASRDREDKSLGGLLGRIFRR